jgi:hypothetical protein
VTDLARFHIGISSLGDADLVCSRCLWHAEIGSDGNLAELVALANGHRCEVVIEGEPPRAEVAIGAGGGSAA